MAEVTAQIPNWWNTTYEDQLDQAQRANRHRERWKYTRSKDALAIADTIFVPENEIEPPSSTQIEQLLADAPEVLALVKRCGGFVCKTMAESGILDLSDDAKGIPLRLTVETGVELELQQTFSTQAVTALWLDIKEGASVTHNRSTLTDAGQWHYVHATIAQAGTYTLNLHSCGANINRQDVQIDCIGTGAHAEITASAVVGPNLHLDQQFSLNHHVADTTAIQTIHNVAMENAKVTCNGRIYIATDAQRTDSQLNNRNLTLGDNAAINTKPELEIYADDVKCAHGATVGRLDDNAAFYLRSRGIAPAEANAMLSRAFIRSATLGSLAEATWPYYEQLLT